MHVILISYTVCSSFRVIQLEDNEMNSIQLEEIWMGRRRNFNLTEPEHVFMYNLFVHHILNMLIVIQYCCN